MNESYTPRPIDTARVQLSERLVELREHLAESIHDTWAQGRLDDGWKYGPQRDDGALTHPGLVPYEALSESEKDYDRRTVEATLKAILALGYRIAEPAAMVAEAQEEASRALVERMKRGKWTYSSLHEEWLRTPPASWGALEIGFEAFARAAFRIGELSLCFDLAQAGLAHHPESGNLRYLHALALVQTGALDAGAAVLEQLHKKARTKESVCLLGRIHKDRWIALRLADPEAAAADIDAAIEAYGEAFYQYGRDTFPGANLGTLLFLAGRENEAVTVATEVGNRAAETAEQSQGIERFWALVTAGETLLVRRDLAAAETYYRQAFTEPNIGVRDRSSSRKQARLLAEKIASKESAFDDWMPLPRVAMVESADDSTLDPSGHEQVIALMQDHLRAHDIGYLFGSADNIAVVLTLEAALRDQREVHLVLPAPIPALISKLRSVGWSENEIEVLESVASRATTVRAINNELPDAESPAWHFAASLVDGYGRLRAKHLDLEVLKLRLLIEGRRRSRASRGRIDIEVPGLSRKMEFETIVPAGPHRLRIGTMEQDVKAMLFADVVGFSRLTEQQIPPFVNHFMRHVSRLITESESQPINANTWGDGLYMVFDDVAAAGKFALELRDLVADTEWDKLRLPENMGIRIALHAGPVYACVDPVTRKVSFTGSHVTFAARMEPVTAPDEVYVSEFFAAMSATQAPGNFTITYIGMVEGPKKYGAFPIYRLERASGGEGREAPSNPTLGR